MTLAAPRLSWLAACAALTITQGVRAQAVVDSFHDVELEARLRQTQIDAGVPEPSGFTSLGIAPADRYFEPKL